jgi:hypothetical protein
MSDKLEKFNHDIATSIAEGKKAERDAISSLKRMSPEELARAPRDLIEDLSPEQYRDVVTHVTKLAQGVDGPVKQNRKRRTIRIPKLTIDLVVIIVTTSTAFLAVLFAPLALDSWEARTPPIRFYDTSIWPTCARLTGWSDGCIYTVSNELSWNAAAHMLDLPPTYLRHVNRHIVAEPIPAGSRLVVWRERGTLRN